MGTQKAHRQGGQDEATGVVGKGGLIGQSAVVSQAWSGSLSTGQGSHMAPQCGRLPIEHCAALVFHRRAGSFACMGFKADPGNVIYTFLMLFGRSPTLYSVLLRLTCIKF